MELLNRMRGGLIVSCQPVDDGPMDRPEIVAAMAAAAVAGGAAGIRIKGVDNLRAARPVLNEPVVGIVKEDLPGSSVRITPCLAQVCTLAEAGADIIAYDGTPRPRHDSREDILAEILSLGKVAMADCATEEDGRAALAGGAAIIGTTLSGYTEDTAGKGGAPDFELVGVFRKLSGAVTVGSALTLLELMTAAFRDALMRGAKG